MVLKKCYTPVCILKNCVIKNRMSVSVFVFRHSPVTKSFVFKFNWIRLKNCAIHLWKIKETHTVLHVSDEKLIENIFSASVSVIKNESLDNIRGWFRNGFYPKTADRIRKIAHKFSSQK